MDFQKHDQGSIWKRQVRDTFSSVRLESKKAQDLENLLLSTELDGVSRRRRFSSKNLGIFFNKLHNAGVGYVTTAMVAAFAAFMMMPDENGDGDPILEWASSQPGLKGFPADFDLEGDPTAFPEMMEEFFTKEAFHPAIPQQIQAHYAPSEGRFFAIAGSPAVSIQLKDMSAVQSASDALANTPENSKNATLYIVKLSDAVSKKFPKDKVSKRIKGPAGKVKKINAWREGKYGFAVVQVLASNEQGGTVTE